jgi:hypothetical protein
MLERVKKITERITMSCLGVEHTLRVERDNEFDNGRVFLQVVYPAPCTKTGEKEEWKGRKWYLSKHMTDDEIVKTAYTAFKSCVEHEIMENFKVDGIILFNPHVSFEELLNVSHKEVARAKKD